MILVSLSQSFASFLSCPISLTPTSVIRVLIRQSVVRLLKFPELLQSGIRDRRVSEVELGEVLESA